MLFYSTFVTGLQEPVRQLLPSVVHMLDGGVLYEADAFCDTPWAHNTFEVLAWEEGKTPLNPFIKKSLKKPLRLHREKTGHFRIMASEENKLISIDPNIKKLAENLITKRTGLTPDRGGSGLEFWFLTRREGFSFFMKRLTYHKAYDNILVKGALTPPLAYMLNALAQPKPGDIMLDPFSGSGAIGEAARKYFPYKTVLESDIEKGRDVKNLLSWAAPGSVQAIVTDPPWGLYNDNVDIPGLYETMLDVFEKVLSQNGRLVLLTAQKDLMIELIKKSPFSIKETYHILVSGKKAGVFVIGYNHPKILSISSPSTVSFSNNINANDSNL